MTKAELVAAIAGNVKMTKSDVEHVLDTFLEVVTGALKQKAAVRLVGFGTFTVRHRKATTARNPKTGSPIQVKASTVPVFKAGKSLKLAVDSE